MVRFRFQGYETVSPEAWGLPPVDPTGGAMSRSRSAVYDFLLRLYDDQVGALHHFYRADRHELGEFDSGNFLMAMNFVAIYDLTGDAAMLDRAASCFRWALEHCTVTHPMAFWQGGVKDGLRPQEVWVKYTGDAFWLAQALFRRTGDSRFREAGRMFDNFLKRALEAGPRYTFDAANYEWREKGNVWRAFGFPVTGYFEWYEATGDARYLQRALAWGKAGLSLSEPDGMFYLLDGEFWNSDLAAPELRGLVYCYEATGDGLFLSAAVRFADHMLQLQRPDGSWPLGIDRDGEVAVATVGPGDPPNLAISLIRLHGATSDDRYLEAAIAAVRYGMSLQAWPGGKYTCYLDDPRVAGGFWSWDPLYDYTLSGDQSVHHIRGMCFLESYLRVLGRPIPWSETDAKR